MLAINDFINKIQKQRFCQKLRELLKVEESNASYEEILQNQNRKNDSVRQNDEEKKNDNLQTEYNHLKQIYEEITNSGNKNFSAIEYYNYVNKCFQIVQKYLTNNDLIVKIINENINKEEKLILDCIMIGTSILCELSDDNDNISLKIPVDDIIMSILRELVDKLSNKIKPFSISDQLIENIVFICLNVARRSNKTKINNIIIKLEYCINIDKINPVIKVGVALTMAFVYNGNHKDILIIKQLIENKIDEITKRKENNWCGLSLNELNEGLERSSLSNDSNK